MFSVVIITHNRPVELERAVRSIRAQTKSPAEIVVVDDGSLPPADPARLQQEAGDVPLRVVRHDLPRGPSGARNAGVAAASQPWIAFLDDDDEFMPEKIAALSNEASECGNDLVIYHPALILMVNEGVSYVSRPQPLKAGPEGLDTLLTKNVVGGTSMVATTRSLLQRIGGFDESLKAFEDYELWIRACAYGADFRLLSHPLTRYHHVTRKKSVTKSKDAGSDAFRAIEVKHKAGFSGLTPSAAREHDVWRYDTLTYRAVLNLAYRETLCCAFATWRRFGGLRHAAITTAAIFGPRFLIRLKAMAASRSHRA